MSMYVGVNDKARKITKAYVGVNGVARKIKAGYVGVNGVARKIYSSGLVLKSFSSATDEEITAMLTAVRNGTITYQDLVNVGWTVGATRYVSLSAMAATGVSESHRQQTQQWVILHGRNFFDLNDGSKNLFVVGLKNYLSASDANEFPGENGKMNNSTTNVGGWNSCIRRTWCNNVFKNAIPAEELNWFKQFKVKTTGGNKSSSIITSIDWFTLPSRAEVFGGSNPTYTPDAEGTTVLDYYSNSSNRVKSYNGVKRFWWLRSSALWSDEYFLDVERGELSNMDPNYAEALSPFGCF